MARSDRIKRGIIALAKFPFVEGMDLLDGSMPYELKEGNELEFYIFIKDPGKFGRRMFKIKVSEVM